MDCTEQKTAFYCTVKPTPAAVSVKQPLAPCSLSTDAMADAVTPNQ